MKNKRNSEKNIFHECGLLFLVVAVVAVSGCIIPGIDVSSMFPQFRPATTEASSDLITTQNLNVIPNPPISAENAFTVSFEVKNNDENEEVDNVNIQRYDSGKCNFEGEGAASSAGGGVSGLVKEEDDATVAFFDVTCPGETTPKKTGFEVGNEVDAQLIGLCGLKTTIKVTEPYKNLEDISVKIGGEEKSMKYQKTKDPQYFCTRLYGKHDTRCMISFANGLNMEFIDIDRTVEKTSCVSPSSCETNCRTTCANKNNIIDKISDKTPCAPYYDISAGFSAYCCTCKAGTRLSDRVGTKTTSVTGDTYMPLQTELNEWQFTAPNNDNLGNMPGSCGIKYKITYDFTAKTQASVDVINADTLSRMQRAGQTPTANPTQSVGVGPIKVFFDFGASQPVRSGDILPIFVTVEDRGTGLLDSGDIVAGNLRFTIPSEFDEVSCSKFSNSGGEWENSAAVPMIKKKSPQLRCSFKMPDVTDIKTFYIEARLDYTYKLDNEIKVSINPTLVK